MALKLPGQWVWDSWFVFDGEKHHAFYLQASRGLGDPERRHRNVTVGHAISDDLINWTVVADALTPSDQPGFDSWTTWTGSTIKGDDGLWYMFYTGTSREDAGQRQAAGLATSTDLMTWTKVQQTPVAAADKRWYKTLEGGFENEPFRDPWVFKIPGESDWTMLTTASSNEFVNASQNAVMGYAKSKDLIHWDVLPPLGKPDSGFGETEVFQYANVDGVTLLLFCCSRLWISPDRQENGEQGGGYSLVVSPDLSDVDFTKSIAFQAPELYAPRLVQDKQGGWNYIGFVNYIDGQFHGELCDPIPVTADPVLGLIRK
jgi:beta-fructofuranosidase